jgi:hypothetical protein
MVPDVGGNFRASDHVGNCHAAGVPPQHDAVSEF